LLAGAVQAEEFLDPAVAFKPSAKALDGQTIEVVYNIAKNYYLYRNKFRFAVDSEAAALGEPILPQGKEKDDDTFGQVEVYCNTAVNRLPVERRASGPLPLRLTVTSQGCAEAGVCYPPQTQTLSLTLPDPATRAGPSPRCCATPVSGPISLSFSPPASACR
jgi:thiol:disulfide interchange protein DsbD